MITFLVYVFDNFLNFINSVAYMLVSREPIFCSPKPTNQPLNREYVDRSDHPTNQSLDSEYVDRSDQPTNQP